MNYRVIAIWKTKKGFPIRNEEINVYNSKEAARYAVAIIMNNGIYVKELPEHPKKDGSAFATIRKKLFPNELAIEPTENTITVQPNSIEKHIQRNALSVHIENALEGHQINSNVCKHSEELSSSDIIFYKVPSFSFDKGYQKKGYSNGRTHT